MVVLRDVSYTATQHEFLSKERINETDYQQYSLDMDWRGDTWRVDAMAGYSGAEKTSDFSNLKHVAYAPSRTRWTGRSGETIPSANPASIDMYNAPAKYLFEAYETTLEKISDDKYAAQLDFTKTFDLAFAPALRSVQFGARYTDKSKERQYGELKITGPTAGSTAWVNTRTLADSPLQSIGDIVPGWRLQPEGTGLDAGIQRLRARRVPLCRASSRRSTTASITASMRTSPALYAMTDFAFDIGRVPVSVNAGARYVDTSVNSFGYHPVQNPDGSTGYTDTPVSKEGSYDDLLPSINATAELAERLAAARGGIGNDDAPGADRRRLQAHGQLEFVPLHRRQSEPAADVCQAVGNRPGEVLRERRPARRVRTSARRSTAWSSIPSRASCRTWRCTTRTARSTASTISMSTSRSTRTARTKWTASNSTASCR